MDMIYIYIYCVYFLMYMYISGPARFSVTVDSVKKVHDQCSLLKLTTLCSHCLSQSLGSPRDT